MSKMYYVWVGDLRVAGSTDLGLAMHYAHQYTEEGDVRVKYCNKILATLYGKGSKTNA